MLAFKAIQGAGWLVFSRFVGRIIDFFTLLVLARILSPADFGLAALATSLVVIVNTVLEIPVTQALVRLPAIDKSHLDTAFTVGLIRSALIAVIVLAAAWPFAFFNHEAMLLPLVAVLALGPISRGLVSPAMVQFARELGFRQTFILEFSGKLIASIIATLIVLSGGAYWAIVANFVIASAASSIVSYVLAPYRPALSLSRLTDFAGFIGWFSSAQLISALNWQFDRFLIGSLADRSTLGRYAVASDVSVIPTQSIIGPALQPVMAAFSQISHDRVRTKFAFLKAARFAMLISVPVCIGMSLTADLATVLLLGQKWSEAAPILSLLALSVVPIPYFQTLYSVSLALDRPVIIFRLNAVDLGIRLMLLPLGFYLDSIMGVSVARIVLSSLMFAFYLGETRSLLALGIGEQLGNLWKVAFASAVMAISVLFLREGLAAQQLHPVVELAFVATMGAAAYTGTLLLLGIRLIAGRGHLELVDRS
ncbi:MULTISPECIES: oligosaccharide flippase family protein [Rhizobium]|uniref:Exopolysaccharide polymerization/export protein n=1 Tax=Rhizobium favelukesii TaxID=348824 RepID=W6S8P4_9HYPH|nr:MULTISPECIES: oligosaccharide flippase family protein [Rhizobium]MCS0459182.1 oligosaccharide flippase family protein [Rhizobium favelukesii]UFS79005.1 oligosaccharide flippase family protein [Rhizobium sp. T136]CDM62491.1 exopolysaccharide polymerization/export protein [Rhizobium favelukesii]